MDKENGVHAFFNKTDNYLHQSFGICVRRDIVRSLIGEIRDKQILDIGCGNGDISAQFLPDNKITFLDLSENMISLVRNRVPPELSRNASYLIGSFEKASIADSFDVVLAIGLLAHVPSVEATLKRIHRVLSPGGRAIVQFSDYEHWLTRLNIRRESRYKYNVNKLSYGMMEDRVEVAGFHIEREIRFALTLPGMGRLPDELMYRYSTSLWQISFLSKLGTDLAWLLRRD